MFALRSETITAGISIDSRMKAKIGANSQITLELWVRDVSANSLQQVLYLPQVEVSP